MIYIHTMELVYDLWNLLIQLWNLFIFIFSWFSYITGLWFIFRSDATCIICREEMTTAKKLLCGHLFHVHCLRSWLERQHTCPTCRAPIIPLDNGNAASAQQHGAQPGGLFGGLVFLHFTHLPCYQLVLDDESTFVCHSWFNVRETAAGTGTSTSGEAPSENVNMRQAKLEAAASAASLYGKSFAYPPASTLNRYISLEYFKRQCPLWSG